MKRTLAVVGLVLGAALYAGPAQAQTGSARGKVVDADGKPLVDAKVVIEFQGGITRKFETKSNKKGDFMQVGLSPGKYKFTVTKEGFRDFTFPFAIRLGDPTDLPTVQLKPGIAGGEAGAAAAAAQLNKEFKAAVDLTNAGKFDEAEAAYKAILAKHPTVPEIHQNLAFIYRQKKDYPAAEAAYQKVIELRPDSADAFLGLATIYQETNRPDDARAMVDKAAAVNPADPIAQYKRGIYLLNANQNEDAIKAFEAVVAADPKMADSYYRLGTLLVGQGKIPEAVQQLEKYLTLAAPATPEPNAAPLSAADAQNVATAQRLIKALKK